MLIEKQMIFSLLRAAPEGLTTIEVAAELGVTSGDVSGRLSKLAAYGEIEKSKGRLPPERIRRCMKQNSK
jgi:DNA-binding MarR family transcriptional regulator